MDIKYAYYHSSVGYKIVGKTDNDILTAGGERALSALSGMTEILLRLTMFRRQGR